VLHADRSWSGEVPIEDLLGRRAVAVLESVEPEPIAPGAISRSFAPFETGRDS